MPTGRATLAPALAFLLLLAAGPAVAQPAEAPTRVRVDTNLGSFTIELEMIRAPLTSANFLGYVRRGFYDGVVFHRVIRNFVAQAGGFDAEYRPKAPQGPIVNESGNGLSNRRGTVGLARGEAPHSGDAQFYLNLADNEALDPNPLRWGYAVFGRVVEGMEVVDRIGHVATGEAGPLPQDAPLDPVVIVRVQVVGEAPTAVPAPAPAPATATETPPASPSG
jgi:cyclophilin family peptidyl-prolyl cis-trans isomerase